MRASRQTRKQEEDKKNRRLSNQHVALVDDRNVCVFVVTEVKSDKPLVSLCTTPKKGAIRYKKNVTMSVKKEGDVQHDTLLSLAPVSDCISSWLRYTSVACLCSSSKRKSASPRPARSPNFKHGPPTSPHFSCVSLATDLC